MKTIGLIGGMSWESTAVYYRLMNEAVRTRLGGLHSAKIVIWSFDFDTIATMQTRGDWHAAEAALIEAGQSLQRAGAEALLICTNTMHKVADAMAHNISIPLLHIADITAQAIHASAFDKVGLLATAFTMEEKFYTDRLRDKHGIETIIPASHERAEIHRIIYEELCRGIIRPESKRYYLKVISELAARGAQGIILGCTEIGLLVSPEDSALPIFDSTQLHAAAAVDWALRA
jgi:aspartate racemase